MPFPGRLGVAVTALRNPDSEARAAVQFCVATIKDDFLGALVAAP